MTYTYATMEVTPATFKEIEEKLRAAGYEDMIMDDGTLDMRGIGLIVEHVAKWRCAESPE